MLKPTREASPPRADVQDAALESSKDTDLPHEATQIPISRLSVREPQLSEQSDTTPHRELE